MKTFKSIFPYDQSVIAEYPLMPDDEIDNALSLAEIAFYSWSEKTFDERADVFKRIAQLLRLKKESLAALMTNEMGKVTKEAIAEIEKCAAGCEYFAENAERLLKDESVDKSYGGFLVKR